VSMGRRHVTRADHGLASAVSILADLLRRTEDDLD
jgi:hypothetical protein